MLRDLGFPNEQVNDRSALTLLALLDLGPEEPWSSAASPLVGITPVMEFAKKRYRRAYAPNSRETFRRFTMHQFIEAGIVLPNPDKPTRPVNSPNTVYQIEPHALALLCKYGSDSWEHELKKFLASTGALRVKYADEREMLRIPVRVADGKTITLSPGGQNVLVERIINDFAERFAPDALTIYVGDTDEKYAYFDSEALKQLGVEMDAHGKMPDVILHDTRRDWLFLIEAVTSHGPVNAKRKAELIELFAGSQPGLVFITAFLTRRALNEYLHDIAWETEVWVAESPTHMLHFDGVRFLGPY